MKDFPITSVDALRLRGDWRETLPLNYGLFCQLSEVVGRSACPQMYHLSFAKLRDQRI